MSSDDSSDSSSEDEVALPPKKRVALPKARMKAPVLAEKRNYVSYASEQRYDEIVAKLKPTNCRLRGIDSYAEYKALKPEKESKLPSTCVKCGVDGEMRIDNFLVKGCLQACLCNGHLRMSTEPAYNRLVTKLEPTNCRLRGIDSYVEYKALNPTNRSKLPSTCVKCGVDGEMRIDNFLCHGYLQACFCNGELRMSTEPAYNRLVAKLEPTNCRLRGIDCYADYKALAPRTVSNLPSTCMKCGTDGKLRIYSFLSRGCLQACLCNNVTEHKALEFARNVCEQLFPARNLVVSAQYTNPTLVGVGGRRLRFDIVVLERLDGRLVPLLFIEVDGPHHFDPNYSYRTGEDPRDCHTFEHDVMKEEHALNVRSSMARLEVGTVAADKASWKAWLQGKLVAAVNRELPHHIYRLSAKDQYVSGPYAARRKGLRIDPELPAGEPYIATGVLVDVSPPMPANQPVNQQRTIEQMFGGAGPSSSNA